ncbi:MAG: hypothetical protein ACRDP4_05910, partial [Nocardioidaceae bacterium]
MHVGQMVRVGAAVALSAALAAPTGAVAAGESASTATNVNSAAMAAGCSPAGVLSHLSRTQRVGQLFVMGVTTTGPTTYQKQ